MAIEMRDYKYGLRRGVTQQYPGREIESPSVSEGETTKLYRWHLEMQPKQLKCRPKFTKGWGYGSVGELLPRACQ